MKTRIAVGTLTAATLIAMAAGRGVVTTTLLWDPYTDTNAVSLRLSIGTNSPGLYYTNIVFNPTNTSYVFVGDLGMKYRAVLTAIGFDGQVSDPSNEVAWTNPPALTAPKGLRTGVIVYVPAP